MVVSINGLDLIHKIRSHFIELVCARLISSFVGDQKRIRAVVCFCHFFRHLLNMYMRAFILPSAHSRRKSNIVEPTLMLCHLLCVFPH